MNMLTRWIEAAKDLNDAEKGVSYSEEAFNQLYEEAMRLQADHKVELRNATGKGLLIGAAGVGLAWVGAVGFKKFRKNKSKKVVEMNIEDFEGMLEDQYNELKQKSKNDDEVVLQLVKSR